MTGADNRNIDLKTVEGFGEEWESFDQSELDEAEHRRLFEGYFSTFPLENLRDGEGFDLGCGSGRWAKSVAPKVRKLHCIDPSQKALDVARRNLAASDNVEFHLAGVDQIPLADDSQDFGYSLGVLHHIPDTQAAMQSCVKKLKTGAPFLVYLYYSFDNRPLWFRAVWGVSDAGRRVISRLPFRARRAVAAAIATTVYWPLARLSKTIESWGINPESVPLSAYRTLSFYTMRTDALDRFGTRLEQRFSRSEVEKMMIASGLVNVRFSENGFYWTACGLKA